MTKCTFVSALFSYLCLDKIFNLNYIKRLNYFIIDFLLNITCNIMQIIIIGKKQTSNSIFLLMDIRKLPFLLCS